MPFQKGHKKIAGREKGTLNRETLTKLERRAIFDKQISQHWEDTIAKLRPEYVADQFMGTAPIKVESLQVKVQLSPATSAKIKEELKQQLINGDK